LEMGVFLTNSLPGLALNYDPPKKLGLQMWATGTWLGSLFFHYKTRDLHTDLSWVHVSSFLLLSWVLFFDHHGVWSLVCTSSSQGSSSWRSHGHTGAQEFACGNWQMLQLHPPELVVRHPAVQTLACPAACLICTNLWSLRSLGIQATPSLSLSKLWRDWNCPFHSDFGFFF
jgi:hypothetical protein